MGGMVKNKHDQALAAVETIYGDKLRELEARFTAGELDWYDRLVREELVFKDKGFREGYLIGFREGIKLGHDGAALEARMAREERENDR